MRFQIGLKEESIHVIEWPTLAGWCISHDTAGQNLPVGDLLKVFPKFPIVHGYSYFLIRRPLASAINLERAITPTSALPKNFLW